MKAAAYDWHVWRGNSESLPITAKRNGVPDASLLQGSTFVMRIVSAQGVQLFRLDGAVAGAVMTFALTPAQAALVPSGRVARYEVERRSGDIQETWLYGFVVGLGGDND
jgi:hypothetical protein